MISCCLQVCVKTWPIHSDVAVKVVRRASDVSCEISVTPLHASMALAAQMVSVVQSVIVHQAIQVSSLCTD